MLTLKKICFSVIMMFISSGLYSQNTNWATLSYYFSNGPVSPEYQYSYRINLNESGEGVFYYTNTEGSRERNFTVSAEAMEKFNKYFKISDVFSVSPDSMKSEMNLMGGSVSTLEVTMWQAPDLDARPTTITIPVHIKDEYFDDINCIYKKIENLVPNEIMLEFIK
ncbi:MAG: hypothetical protein IPM38_11755 [Ignavibacteria bacterium]|nr:hypothetical protein [Ignavibacteria bacterium]